MFSFTTFFSTLFFLIFVAQATPVALTQRSKEDVFVPTILKPDSNTIWRVGHEAIISWDTSNAPKSISNGASIVLSNYEFNPLVAGFDLRVGNVTVIVPNVTEGPYFITLFGDSGDYSPVFTISN